MYIIHIPSKTKQEGVFENEKEEHVLLTDVAQGQAQRLFAVPGMEQVGRARPLHCTRRAGKAGVLRPAEGGVGMSEIEK